MDYKSIIQSIGFNYQLMHPEDQKVNHMQNSVVIHKQQHGWWWWGGEKNKHFCC